MNVRLQPIYDIAELCAQKGVTQAVICPGSRCAPLTLALVRHGDITVRTFSDERSAAFIATGIAHETQAPALLLCTSGSAAYNFAPAIAEAYFQQLPLIVFTADRPKEWIDQHDGQTIRQPGIFGSHVKKSFTLPEDYGHPDAVWYLHRTVNEAINLANEEPKGPVHINVPLREPLYPVGSEKIAYSNNLKVIHAHPTQLSISEKEKISLELEKAGLDKNQISSLSGITALGAAQLSGFGVYLLASSTVGAITSVLGITLPFAFYTGMYSVISFVIGPVGFLVMGVMIYRSFKNVKSWDETLDILKMFILKRCI